MNWSQFQTILWLRWRLTKNQFARGGQLNAILLVIGLVLMVAGGAGLGVVGLLAGWFSLGRAQPQVLLLVWDVVLFVLLVIWLSGLLVEIQRSESIDLTKLLHLPVTLQKVFVFNYVASFFVPSLALMLPGMVGLCLGLIFGAGPAFILLLFVVTGFIFMLTAWTYCLRGWLAALMTDKRRRRTVVVWVTLAIVLVAQLPNIVVHSPMFRSQMRPRSSGKRAEAGPLAQGLSPALVDAHGFVPPGWPGYSALTLKEGAYAPALGAAVASFLLGALGLIRAYRMTMRFYQGAEPGHAKPIATAATASRPGRPPGVLLVERRLPGVPDDVGALALATLRSLLRAPELKMAMIMPAVGALALLFVFSTQRRQVVPPEYVTAFAATAAVVASVFAVAPMMSNAFGLDRNGFRALVLLPTPRHHVLLAKNLAFFPFAAISALLLLVLLQFFLHASPGSLLAAILQVPLAFLIFSPLCNLLAILVPYRLAAGTLQAKKPKAVVFLAAFLMMLLLPIVMLPVVIPPGLQYACSYFGLLPWLPINLIGTATLLVLAAGLYWLLLPAQGRLLTRREQAILKEVTEETE